MEVQPLKREHRVGRPDLAVGHCIERFLRPHDDSSDIFAFLRMPEDSSSP